MNMITTIKSPSTKSIINHHHHPKFTNNGGITKPIKPPIIISTNPKNINITTLSQLYVSCNHSPNQFAGVDVDAGKLAVAVEHSAAVVAVFAAADGGGRWGLGRRVSPENGELVGFGRAVSDLGLTASIYDVMVIPTLRRLGIGSMIVQRILRMLTNRGVYDISALCSDNERSFFEACGFGDDILGSTTMTYARSVSSDFGDNDRRITRDSQRLLLIPTSTLPIS